MNTEHLTLAQIARQMEDLCEEMQRSMSMMKGAKLYREAFIKEHPSQKHEAFKIFDCVVRPFQHAFDSAVAQHNKLYSMSIGKEAK